MDFAEMCALMGTTPEEVAARDAAKKAPKAKAVKQVKKTKAEKLTDREYKRKIETGELVLDPLTAEYVPVADLHRH